MKNEIMNDAATVANYFDSLIGMFFKILPMYENKDSTLKVYMQSFFAELSGFRELVTATEHDGSLVSLEAILKSLMENIDKPTPDVDVKREVFKAISICKRLRSKYGDKGFGDDK